MNLKIFCIYFKPSYIFSSDYIIPIQAGTALSPHKLEMIGDDTGDNISDKNLYYGELTVWYWIWKNYLNQNKDLDYLGFCHYRRFLDFTKKPLFKPFHNIEERKYVKLFNKQKYIDFDFSNYDIILPKMHTKSYNHSVEEDYLSKHPKQELDIIKEVLQEKYPHYSKYMHKVLTSKQAYHCLNFIMRKDLFLDLLNFTFDILFEVEKRSDWSSYREYYELRTQAYLMEHFFNVWLLYQVENKNLKILHRKGYKITSNLSLSQKIMKKVQYLVPIKSIRKGIREKYNLR